MRIAIVVGFVISCCIASAQEKRDTVEPSAESLKISRAAEEFARSVAGEMTPHYAKVFEYAISAVNIPAISGGTRPRTPARAILSVRPATAYRGMTNDPRYFTNLYQTHAKKIPKIWGGQPVTGNAYADVVAVLGHGGVCTGTLVTSKVVVTAAHCHYKGIDEKVVFGNDISDPKAVVVEVEREKTVTLAADGEWAAGDLSLLFLKSEVTAVVPRRIARAEWIRQAQTVTAVGFGYTETGGIGVKNVVDIVMASPGCDGKVSVAGGSSDDADYYHCGRGIEVVAGKIGGGKDTCGGDSGGPLYVAGPDGALYLAAATSRIVDWPGQEEKPCGDGGIYSRVDTASTWAATNGVTLQFGSPVTTAGTRSSRWSAEKGASLVSAMAEPGQLKPGRIRVEAVFSDTLREIVAPGTEVRGRIAITATGGAVLIPESRPEIRIPIMNLPEPTAAQDLPVSVTIDEIRDGGVSVKGVQLSAADEFDGKRTVLTPLKYPRLTRVVDEINRSFAAHLQRPFDAQAEQTLKGYLREGEMIAALALQKSDRGTARSRAAGKVFAALHRTNKAFYRRNDRYPPMAYERIFHNTRGTVALTKRDDGKPYCSGVLISPQYVMTNQHCSEFTPSSNVDVKFNYELGLDDVALPFDTYRVTGYEFGPRSERHLDVILLRLDRPAVQHDGAPWPSQCLSTRLVSSGSPLYVVGHPRQSFRTVADNSHALFPFEVTKQELTTLRGGVIADYEGQDFASRILKDFDDSYRAFVLNQNETIYRYYTIDTGQPTIGIDSDTAEGNSGSPVYSRRSHDVIGLFVAGIEGELDLEPGFAFHEDVIPMSEIVRQMEEHHPTWTDVVQPCIDGLKLGQKCSCH